VNFANTLFFLLIKNIYMIKDMENYRSMKHLKMIQIMGVGMFLRLFVLMSLIRKNNQGVIVKSINHYL
jgi:hypothetical protein